MSRSIHDNKSRRLLIARGFMDWAEIAKKRRVKTGVRSQRSSPTGETLVPRHADSVPVTVIDTGAPLFFPAERADLSEVLSRLPPGVLDGLRGIRVHAGTAYVNAKGEGGVPDPFLHRRSEEILRGVYAPVILGAYNRASMEVDLFAFVRAPGTELSSTRLLELRFQMLKTLVHELAHHFDRTRRVARGRWRMDDTEKAERYADVVARRWCLEVVVPYLMDRYVTP